MRRTSAETTIDSGSTSLLAVAAGEQGTGMHTQQRTLERGKVQGIEDA